VNPESFIEMQQWRRGLGILRMTPTERLTGFGQPFELDLTFGPPVVEIYLIFIVVS